MIQDRPGYAQAMKVPTPSSFARSFTLVAAACCGGLVYACKLYVSATWLMWILMVLFGVLAATFVLAAIGFSSKFAGQKWSAAVIDKLDGQRVKFLRGNGDEHELHVGEQVYGLLRAGDVGVLYVSGNGPAYSVDSFTRL